MALCLALLAVYLLGAGSWRCGLAVDSHASSASWDGADVTSSVPEAVEAAGGSSVPSAVESEAVKNAEASTAGSPSISETAPAIGTGAFALVTDDATIAPVAPAVAADASAFVTADVASAIGSTTVPANAAAIPTAAAEEIAISEADLFGLAPGIRSDVLQNELLRYESTLRVAPRVAAQVNPGTPRNSSDCTGSTSSVLLPSRGTSQPNTNADTAACTSASALNSTAAGNTALNPGIPAPPERNVTSSADIWLMDTNWISRTNPTPEQFQRMTCQQWKGGRIWENRTLEDFTSTLAPGQPVLIYIHGNQTDTQEAIWHGLQTLRCLPAMPQARLVVFDWPAQRISPLLRVEFGTKAVYADYQGFYLAQLLSQMSGETPILLVGHSFGSRTALSALHLMSGGSYAGRTLDLESTAKPVELDLTVVLVAAATNYTDFVPNGVFSQAPKMAKQIRVVKNQLDPALKFYPMMGARAPLPEAMGKVGPTIYGMAPEEQSKVRVLPVLLQSHSYLQYLTLPEVVGLIQAQ